MTDSSCKWSHSLSMSTIDENYEHDFLRIFLIICTILIFLCSIVLNFLYITGSSLFGIYFYQNNANNLFVNTATFINGSSSSHAPLILWSFIFAWQLSWLCYGLTTLCRKSSSDYLYKYPPVMHWLIYFNFSFANILYTSSLVFWSRNLNVIAMCYALLTFISLYIAAFISLFKLFDYQREMHYTEK